LAYDSSDAIFSSNVLREAFQTQFQKSTSAGPCLDRAISTSLTLVKCDYTGRPTWSQNDAMLEAYLDEADYFYRVNDDTV